MRYFLLLLGCLPFLQITAQWSGNTSPTYQELIQYYKELDRKHPEIELYAMGESDTEWPIYVCIINGAGDSLKTFEKAKNSTTLLVNNAIHAGEPDGVNACLIWIDEWIKNGKKTKGLPVIAFIPAYNVGGMFNRSSTSRANQEGPEVYGFRGNAQNLDLNRDFMKMDSKNAFTFAKIYQSLNPDVFVDTHVSNGADYQYTLTLISSMKERLAPSIRKQAYESCLPELTAQLKTRGTDLAPYVELEKETPDEGIVGFNDLPRYAMGYASLFHSLSFTVETHMLKPFPQRVEATRKFIDVLINYIGNHSGEIETARSQAIDWSMKQETAAVSYQLSPAADSLLFKGFKAIYKPSIVTGLQRLFYDRSQPYTKNVPYFNTFVVRDSAAIPKGYIVSGSTAEVIRRLAVNNVRYSAVRADSMAVVSVQQIIGYESPKKPYEGHFLHHSIKAEEVKETVLIRAGSIYVSTAQPNQRFILAALEPMSEDSYFAWNFFDSYLQQKEYFSSYVFEDKAAEILANDPVLAADFRAKQQSDPEFAKNAWDQLLFIYKRSAYYEKSTVNRLPVYKVY